MMCLSEEHDIVHFICDQILQAAFKHLVAVLGVLRRQLALLALALSLILCSVFEVGPACLELRVELLFDGAVDLPHCLRAHSSIVASQPEDVHTLLAPSHR